MKKILIIDYDQNSLTSLQAIFAGLGYQVVTAADGQAGWDRYNKESPDLVLMEAMLPKVHGFELCQRITSERNSQATVFIMTGVYKDRVYRTEALRTYGASEYFEKPLKMAELLASVEAVLGKPEPKPAEARPAAPLRAPAPSPVGAQPAPVLHAESAPAEPRKPKAKSDDTLFALPEDLDRLSRGMPKPRKPSFPRPDPAAEQRFDALADQLLKTVIVESSTPKTVQPKPAGGNGNGNGGGNGADIDRFLKSALAGLDLNKEKVKVAKPAPQPVIPPVQEKPAPAPVRPAAPEPKPTPPPAPHVPEKPSTPPPAADMKNTLTPGDPGSDVSPFFTPETAKPIKPAEKAEKKAAPAPTAVPARHEAPRPEPAHPESKKRPAERPQPAPAPTKAEEAPVLAASTIFQDAVAPREKKGFPTFLVVGLGIAAVAAVAFFLLRPKHPAPVVPAPQQTAETTTANTPSQPIEPPAAPVAKPTPAKQKAQPQTKPAEQTGAQAIMPTQEPTSALPMPGSRTGSDTSSVKTAAGTDTAASGLTPPKTEEAASPAGKTETAPPQNQANDGAASSAPAAPTVSVPAAAPVHEGDLVELGAVTELPKVLKKTDPVYPAAAQRIGREGNITVNALIDEKGNIIDTGILKGIQDDKGLGKAAEAALRKWKFQPARKDGVAVKVWKPFVIAFKADASPAK